MDLETARGFISLKYCMLPFCELLSLEGVFGLLFHEQIIKNIKYNACPNHLINRNHQLQTRQASRVFLQSSQTSVFQPLLSISNFTLKASLSSG